MFLHPDDLKILNEKFTPLRVFIIENRLAGVSFIEIAKQLGIYTDKAAIQFSRSIITLRRQQITFKNEQLNTWIKEGVGKKRVKKIRWNQRHKSVRVKLKNNPNRLPQGA